MPIASADVFTLVHDFSPRRGPADACGVEPRLLPREADRRRWREGWGETYLRTGMPAILEELARCSSGGRGRRPWRLVRRLVVRRAAVRDVGDVDRR